MLHRLAVVLLAGALALSVARAEVAVPPVARVTDLTGTLSAAQQAALSEKLAAFEARKGSQIAVLLVPTTAPEDIAGFSIRVVDQWKLGRKGIDDGLIVIIAKDDRRMRIEVGRGLEGVVTDLTTSRVREEYLQPGFRAGDFYGGIDRAVDRLIGLIDGEPLPPPLVRATPRRAGSFQGIVPVLLLVGLIAGPLLRRLLGRPVGAIATGGIAGFLTFLLLGLASFAALAAVIGFFLTLLGGLGGAGWAAGRGGGLGGGGFGGGGFGGGGFGGGGGFSGGGGGFSGGGSSGSW